MGDFRRQQSRRSALRNRFVPRRADPTGSWSAYACLPLQRRHRSDLGQGMKEDAVSRANTEALQQYLTFDNRIAITGGTQCLTVLGSNTETQNCAPGIDLQASSSSTMFTHRMAHLACPACF